MKLEDLDLDRLRKLAGISLGSGGAKASDGTGQDSVLTHAGTERAQYARQHHIEPGTDEWFKLWFSRPLWFKEGPNR